MLILKYLLHQADTNGDNAIDFDEFMTIFKTEKVAKGPWDSDFEKYFQKFDKDDDGFISKAEFKKKIKSILKKLGIEIPNDEIKDAFKLIDSNGDGNITLDEFENIVNIPLGKKNCGCTVIIIIIIIVRK